MNRRWLVLIWWLLAAMSAAVLVAITQPAPAEVVRLGPAEDEVPLAEPPAESLPRVGLAPLDESMLPTGFAERPGLYVATGGPPLPLRTGPDPGAPVLVQVPNQAPLDDLGESTPDGAWQRVSWDGWEGWIAAGLLRRRQ